jgi:crotonobetainyl-CoA:carnitine CoA-transferase CaiB-like acyl-CoA transferase
MLAGELPFYRLYRTRDSGFLAVAAIEPQFWEELCKLINRPDLLQDQYSSGSRRNEVIEAIQLALATKTSEEWFRIMREHKLPCTPLLRLDEVLKDPQARERHMLFEKDQSAVSRMTYVGSPCKIAGLETVDLIPSPRLGQHSAELLRQVGYSESEIRNLIETGVTEQSGQC